MVRGEQAVEREQRGEQRTEPEDRGADPAQLREIRPNSEWNQRHNEQEKQYAHQCAAADPYGEARVADEEGGEGGHD